MSAKEALHKYLNKQIKQNSSRTPKRRNRKPEEEVVRSIKKWAIRQSWSIHRVDSTAVYSISAGRYNYSQAATGVSDIVGNDSEGIAVYIEVKAPGKLSKLRPGQAVFLKEKIRTNAFAVCVDRVELLANIYVIWSELSNIGERKRYLMDLLPKKFEDL